MISISNVQLYRIDPLLIRLEKKLKMFHLVFIIKTQQNYFVTMNNDVFQENQERTTRIELRIFLS